MKNSSLARPLVLALAVIMAAGLLMFACREGSRSPTETRLEETAPAVAPAAQPGPGDGPNPGLETRVEQAQNREGKVEICHRTGNGSYHLIRVDASAEPAHRAHGDAFVGEPVPGLSGMIFDSSCSPIDEGADIDLEKATNGADADFPPGPRLATGERVSWTYVVTNIGQVALSGVSVVDDQGVAVSCPRSSLAMGESMTCTATGTAEPDQYANVGTATGTGIAGSVVSDSDLSHYFGADAAPENPVIDIEKATNGADADSPPGPTIPAGSPVQWTYVVTNRGDVTLTSITVVDDKGVAVSCPQTSLLPGEFMTCTASGTAVRGQYRNVGTAAGTSFGGRRVSDSDPSHYFNEAVAEHPAIAIEKATNGADADDPPGPTIAVGDPVQWTYLVTNTGDVLLSGITVTDDRDVAVSCPRTNLNPGESMTCTGSGTAREGRYTNVGRASGVSIAGTTVEAFDSSNYFGEQQGENPAVLLEKRTNGQPSGRDLVLPVGSAVQWTYEVTNTGNVTLSGIQVIDNQGVAVTCPQTTLASGASMTCTASGTAVAGEYTNVGTVTATSPGGAQVSSSDTSGYFGQS